MWYNEKKILFKQAEETLVLGKLYHTSKRNF